ncbi:MAG: hypothetical protein K8F57_03405, partial [Alphaproteobacteria bacterium]|nr:hypothetical protein [Alphaproteobacteria bacterium]
ASSCATASTPRERCGCRARTSAATYPPAPSDYPVLDPMIYSLDVLLPIVDLHQESYWLPSVNKPYGALARWYMWLHIAVGWIFTTLAVAGFTGLVKKD